MFLINLPVVVIGRLGLDQPQQLIHRGHLARFVESGDLSLSEIIPQERQDAIMKVIRRIGKEEGRTAIKNLCPPDVTYAEIELVLLCLKA